MKDRRTISLSRFTVLFLVAGVLSCDGTTPPAETNRAPVAIGVIPPLTLVVGDSHTVDASAFFSDPDGDDLSYSATSSNDAVLTVAVDGSDVTATAVAAGMVFVTITATDPDGLSASHRIDVTVQASNRAPVAVGEVPPLTLNEGEEFTASVDQFFSDPDGDALTYAATVSDISVATASISGATITVNALAAGMANITLTATDPGGLSATQMTTVTVMAVNQGPTITDTIPHQDLTVGDTLTLDAADYFSDPDGDALTFTADTDDAAVATVSVDGSMVTVVAVGAGSALVSVTATDPGGLSATQTFAANVATGNRAPMAVGEIPPLVLPEGESVTASVDQVFSDPDGDTLTYAAAVSDTTVASASISGSLITVMALAEGMATITITATDPGGLSATQSTTITVVAVNQAPTITDTIPHQDLTVGDTLTLDAADYFSDPDGDALTFTTDTDDAAVATVSVDGSTVTVVAVGAGRAAVSVTATDPGGLAATQTFEANVAAANQAPMAVGEIAAQTVTAGNSVTVDVSGNFSDPDNDDLTYTAASSDEGAATVGVSGAMVTVTGVAAGSATVTVTATDPGGLSATQTFDVTVVTGNQAPMAVGEIAAQTVTAGDSVAVDVSGNFSDPDNDDLTYTAASSDEGAATASVSGAMVTVTGVAAGSATVTVTATDPGGLSATQTFDVTVSAANRAPMAVGEIPPLVLLEGESVTASVDQVFSDPDGDTLTYAAAVSDTTVASASISGSLITVMALAEGMATITVTATDPGGLSATQSTTINVMAVNQAPTITDTIPHQDLTVDDTLMLDAADYFSDPDGDALTFTADTDDETVATVSVDGSTVTVVAVGAGSAFITVTATDPGGLSVTQTFAANVATGNRAPMAVGEIAAQTVTAGDSVAVDVSGNFSDPDNDDLTYTAASSDDGAATASVSGAMVTVTGVAAGSATVTVTATDPGGLSAMQTFDVTVNAANQTPEISDTIPVHDLLWVPDTVDMTMADTMTSVVLDMAGYFSDPDGDSLTYTASVSDPGTANVETVEGSVVTTVAVSSDTTFAHDTTMITVTATDPDGLSVSQEAMVLVANSDYEPWDIIQVNENGTLTLTTIGITLSVCFAVDNIPLAPDLYTAHWTAWQVKKGSGWVMVPGTYTELNICPYLDLPEAPAGTYRVVGEISIRPIAGTEDDWVRSRRKSGNEVTITNN